MKMVAASKLRRAQERMIARAAVRAQMQRVLRSVASARRPVESTRCCIRCWRRATPTARTLVIVVTADKGLCGSFNTNVIKAAGALRRSRARSVVHARPRRPQGRATSSAAAASRSLFEQVGHLPEAALRGRAARSRRPAIDAFIVGQGRPRGAASTTSSSRSCRSASSSTSCCRSARRATPSGRAGARRAVDYLYEPSPQEIFRPAAAALRRGAGLPRAARVERRVLRRADDGDGHGDEELGAT